MESISSAFAPWRQKLSTDVDFKPNTVAQVSGRGSRSQHRDALYAIFRVRARRNSEQNPHHVPGKFAHITGPPQLIYYLMETHLAGTAPGNRPLAIEEAFTFHRPGARPVRSAPLGV